MRHLSLSRLGSLLWATGLLVSLGCTGGEEDAPGGPGQGDAVPCANISYTETLFAGDEPPEDFGHCLARSFVMDIHGQAPCVAIEARRDEACTCDGPRQPVADLHQPIADELLGSDGGQAEGWNCACELVQLADDELSACQHELEVDASVVGWCYLDGTRHPPLGNPDLLAPCPETEQRLWRVLGGDQQLAPRGGVILHCEQSGCGP